MSVVSIAVAVLTLGVFLSVSFADSAYQTAYNTLENFSNNAVQGLENTMSSTESTMTLLANQIGYNKEFANNITNASDSEAMTKVRKSLSGEDMSGDGSTIIGAMDYMILSDSNIESVTMYSPFIPEDQNAFERLYHVSKSQVPFTEERYNALKEHSGRSFWFFLEEDEKHVYVWEALVNYGVNNNSDMQVVGYLEYVFTRANFLLPVTDTHYNDEGMILLDENGLQVLFISCGDELIDSKALEALDKSELGLSHLADCSLYKQNTTKQGWTYLTYINHSSVDETIKKSTNLTVVIVVASVFAAAFLSYLLAAREVKRIKTLSAAASDISSGHYDVRLERVANDEITDVSESFNTMASKVQETLETLIIQQDSISENFAIILSNKSGESGNHVKRVSEYSALLAKELGFAESEVHDIRIASMLHDVGKIMIDETILHKPGRFTDEEYKIMQKHVDFGGQLLKGVPGNIMQLGAIIAQYHHERWDGNGYTQKLKGDDIPVCAQITAVADVFDALVSKRCYKDAWTIEQAYDEIMAQSGKQFAPKVVEAFDKRFEEFKQIAALYKDE